MRGNLFLLLPLLPFLAPEILLALGLCGGVLILGLGGLALAGRQVEGYEHPIIVLRCRGQGRSQLLNGWGRIGQNRLEYNKARIKKFHYFKDGRGGGFWEKKNTTGRQKEGD